MVKSKIIKEAGEREMKHENLINFDCGPPTIGIGNGSLRSSQ